MTFSLIANPLAYQICQGHRVVVLAATLFGVLSVVFGFPASFYFDLPTGDCIIMSNVLFGVSAVYRRFRAISVGSR